MARGFKPQTISSDSALGSAVIQRSLRFNDGDSAHLNRTPSSAGNRKTWTLSVWVKRTTIDANQRIFTAYDGSNVNAECNIQFQSDGKIQINNNNTSDNTDTNLKTDRLFRDPSAWYHIVIGTDMTQGTSSNRVNLYINGTQETSFSTESYGTQNVDWWFNNNSLQTIGRRHNTTERPFDGYMAEFNFIDGSQLDPSYFGFTDPQTGIWMPKRFDKSSIPNKKGRTFSSTWTASGNGFGGSNPITNAFDGDLSTSANNDGGGQILTWNTSTYNLRGELRIYCRSSSGVYDIYVNGNSGNTTKVGDTPSSNGWVDCGTFDHIKEIQFAGTTYNTDTGLGSAGVHILAIMVDGTLLRDDMDEFGTNGFYLDFSDNSSTSTLGIDKSPNGNDYTPNNFSVSSGEGNDSVEDTPTNNWATLNSLDPISNVTFSEGNLKCVRSNAGFIASSNFVVTSGKWYMEMKYVSGTSNHQMSVGFTNPDRSYQRLVRGGDGELTPNTGNVSVTFADPDVLMLALDVDNGKWYIGKNGSYMLSGDPANGTGFVHSGLSSSDGFIFMVVNNTSTGGQTISANFGQQGFSYTPPTGFKAFNSQNLPPNVPSIVRPKRHFDTILYTGNASTQKITGLDFKPDMIWFKSRTSTSTHGIADSVRGRSKLFYPDTTQAEETSSTTRDLVSFDDGGFTVGNPERLSSTNGSGLSIVAWCWEGGGSSNTFNVDGIGYATANAAGITDGNVAITGASVNRKNGFSVVTYTGSTASGALTVGHGLNKKPAWVLIKRRDDTGDWIIGHQALATNAFANSKFLKFETNSVFTNSLVWGAEPTTTVTQIVTDGSAGAANLTSSGTYVMYSWAEIPGYSKFGSYDGSGSSDGRDVNIGFKPAWLLVKRIDDSKSWFLWDNKRDPFNLAVNDIYPNQEYAENHFANNEVDLLSNGFKLRNSNSTINADGGQYIYMAFAEQPGTTPFTTFPNAR